MALKLFEGSAHASPMAFLVAGTLQVASQVAEPGKKGRRCLA